MSGQRCDAPPLVDDSGRLDRMSANFNDTQAVDSDWYQGRRFPPNPRHYEEATMNTTLTSPAVTDAARYEQHAIDRVTDALRREFAGRVPTELIERTVADAREPFGDAPVREFVPLLVERAARASIRAMVGSAPVPSRDRPHRT